VASYPAFKVHAPYCIVICGHSNSTMFSHIISWSNSFRKRYQTWNVCFDFLYNFCQKYCISHSYDNSARYCHKCSNVFMLSARYCCQTLIKYEFSQQILEKYWNIKFNKYMSSGSRAVSCGQQTDMTMRRVAFRNVANAPKKVSKNKPLK